MLNVLNAIGCNLLPLLHTYREPEINKPVNDLPIFDQDPELLHV
jgi:hypothetical protein